VLKLDGITTPEYRMWTTLMLGGVGVRPAGHG
jgi:hypothetical protein